MKKILRFINQPLAVGFLILVSTSLFQQWGWRSQQNWIAKQSRASAAVQQKQTTIDQVTVAVGKLLTSYASIIGAHREKVKTKQLNETIDQYHALQREWDQGEDMLKLRMHTCFPGTKIESDWSSLLDRLGELDSEIHKLHDFDTTDLSEAHLKQITVCGQTITDVEQRLASMTSAMTDYVNASSVAQP